MKYVDPEPFKRSFTCPFLIQLLSIVGLSLSRRQYIQIAALGMNTFLFLMMIGISLKSNGMIPANG